MNEPLLSTRLQVQAWKGGDKSTAQKAKYKEIVTVGNRRSV